MRPAIRLAAFNPQVPILASRRHPVIAPPGPTDQETLELLDDLVSLRAIDEVAFRATWAFVRPRIGKPPRDGGAE